MKIAILREPGRFVLEERSLPEIGDGDVLIKTKACGICTSELDMWRGNVPDLDFPKFIGHEVSGVVEERGSRVSDFGTGDRVAVWTEGEGYADYIACHESYLYKLQNETPFNLALGEPIACAVNGVRKLDPQLNDSVCIVGCGFMGLIMLQVFRIRGAGLLIAVDTRDTVLELAHALGANHVFNPESVDVRNAIRDLTGGKGVDIGVEAAGVQETLDLVTDLVRMEGKLEVFGYHQGEPRKVRLGYWNWMAFQIVNGHTRSPGINMEGMKIGLELLESKKLNMADLVTHSFALDQVNRAFELAVEKPSGFIKGVITL